MSLRAICLELSRFRSDSESKSSQIKVARLMSDVLVCAIRLHRSLSKFTRCCNHMLLTTHHNFFIRLVVFFYLLETFVN